MILLQGVFYSILFQKNVNALYYDTTYIIIVLMHNYDSF